MNSNQNDVLAILSEQYRHQVRVARTRMNWWMPWDGICIISFCVSIPFITAFLAKELTLSVVVVFALCAVVVALYVAVFGYGAVNSLIGWLTKPSPRRLRIVPYFARGLGYPGERP